MSRIKIIQSSTDMNRAELVSLPVVSIVFQIYTWWKLRSSPAASSPARNIPAEIRLGYLINLHWPVPIN